MLSKRLSLILLLAAFAITASRALTEKSDIVEEFEEDEADYEAFDESENETVLKSEQGGKYPPPPPLVYPALQLPPPQIYQEQKLSYQQPVVPNQTYLPIPVPNYSIPIETVYEQAPVIYPTPTYSNENELPIDYQQELSQAYSPPQNVSYQANQSPIVSYQQPQASYQQSQPNYQPPQVSYQPPQVSYQAPQVSYQAPQVDYQPPQVSYQPPQVSYQPPQVSYQPPQVSYQQPQGDYQPKPVDQQPQVVEQKQPQVSYQHSQTSYQQPQVITVQSQTSYQEPQTSYQKPQIQQPQVVSYQPPQVVEQKKPQVVYQQPQVVSYQPPQVVEQKKPQVVSYQPPQVVEQKKPQVVSYQLPQVVEQKKPQVVYPQSQPSYVPIEKSQSSVGSNYSVQQPIYNKPSSSYKPIPVPQKPSYVQQPKNYVSQQPIPKPYTQVVPTVVKSQSKYSAIELASMVPYTGYRANHWTLFYYRASPYRLCPKNVYLNGPSLKDIEAAFALAKKELQISYSKNIQYLNSTLASSWTTRHQIFSFMTQGSARMDEEGLLVELVSQYLSDRACLTKWDKQRYLPTLTKIVSVGHFPQSHSCTNLYSNQWQSHAKVCAQSKYRTYDGFCNNPYHPYWGKSNVCHIRLLSPDYADGISSPRNSYNPRYPLPNPRAISNYIHNDIPLEGPYNLMKMQWGQFINHDITNTALSAYDGLVDCCRNPSTRGCWPIYVPPGDPFYSKLNVTCLNFIRSGVCPTCQLGPRQQINKNTAFLDASHIYGQNQEQSNQLRTFKGGELKVSVGANGEVLLPLAQGKGQEQCSGACFVAGDSRVNQHPALTVMHTLLLRNHNRHARALSLRHPNWNDETIFQEARRIVIAEYQMITFNEYLPIIFGPILSAYYQLIPSRVGYSQYQPKVDPTTWNEYSTATCRFGHSQIQSTFGLYRQIYSYNQKINEHNSFRLKDWFMRPSLLSDGRLPDIVMGMLSRASNAVDPWVTNDVRNHLYQSHKEFSGGDLVATNIWRGRDHGLPAYVHYVEYCFNYKVHGWKDLSLFIPYHTINQLRKLYRVVENIDLFTGGLAERHFPGADTGPTFACVNGIQYYHLKFGDRFYFEHGGQAGSFNPAQLDEIRRTTLARLLCHNSRIPAAPQYAFLQPSQYNPLINCSSVGNIDYNKF